MGLALNYTAFKTLIDDCAKQGPTLVENPLPTVTEGLEQSAAMHPPAVGGKLRVHWVRCEALGNDERREEWDAQAQMLNVTFVGNRTITFRVFAESFDESDDLMALLLLENLRSRIQTESIEPRLEAAGVALADVGAVTNEFEFQDDRVMAKAYLEILVNTGIEYQDINATTIETVNLEEITFTR